MILSNIKEFLGRNKKILYYISLFFIVSFLTSDVTFAATGDTNVAQSIASGANEFLSVVNLLMGLVTYLATMFLSPEWINGTLFGLSGKFKEIWIMVSNIVYFIFAFLLIWIAFMNIIGKDAEQYQLKQALPKFIVGVLIVPFSWFLVQFILSISSILTVSALTLPYDSFPKFKDAFSKIEIPNDCYSNISSDKQNKEGGKNNLGDSFWCKKDSTITVKEIMNSGDSSSAIFGVLSMYTYGITGIEGTDNVSKIEANAMTQLGDIAMKLVFDVLILFIYFILIVALGLVLMIRGIYIWIYIMLSPVFGLMYFFDKKDGGDGFFAKFNIKEFIALAMVPVYTMLALSFGMLFIYVVGTGLTLTGEHQYNTFKVESSEANKTSTIIIGGDTDNNKNIKFTIKGTPGTSAKKIDQLVKGSGNKVLGYIGMLILKLFGIVVLWGTVMAAMRTSEITKAITEPLHQFGTKVGGIVTSAPGNIPVFGGQSANSMGQIAGKYQQAIAQTSTDRANKFAEKAPFLQKNAEVTGALSRLNDTINSRTGNEGVKTLKADYTDLIKSVKGDSTKALSSTWLQTAKKLGDKYGIDTSGFKNGTEKEIADTILTKFEKQLDGSIAGGLTSKIVGDNSSAMGKDDVKRFFRDISTGTAEVKSGNTSGNIKSEYQGESAKGKIFKVDGAPIEVVVKDGKQLITDDSSLEKLARIIQGGLTQEEFKKDILVNMGITSDNEIEQLYKKIGSKLYKDSRGNLSLVKMDGYTEIKDGKIW